ncbi:MULTISPECIES: LysR family transcriptional regulator [Micrococcaceae]|jgi:DNA-binding transcriptional LysR family regulator|uniref:LysR substrate-binding domain-containing protein n=1 Tax=Micrococcaceae TaxID=1268 RepID=UPI002097B73C|nr:LysR family transcriptional regulator [Arthrobacter sp. H16F315]MDD1475386.1 LysR substrate-binding domain-containing protein [Arthrobacter sp. H16F315]
MEIRHLRAFVAVAEDLNFTRAASRLFLAQQALSSQIRQLEDEVGTRLFDRTTRKVELTTAGEVFYSRATRILEAIEEAKAVARNAGLGDGGHLHLAYSHSLGIECLPQILDELHVQAPQVNITAAVTLADQAISGLARGQFDLVLVRSPILPASIESVLLRREVLGVILSAKHPAAADTEIHVDRLAETTIVMWPRGHSPGYADLVLGAFPAHDTAGRVRVYETFTHGGFLDDRRSLEEMQSGRAFQVAFETQYQPLPEGFVWRPLKPELYVPVELLHREGPLTPAQRTFIEIAREVSRLNGWLDHESVPPSRD